MASLQGYQSHGRPYFRIVESFRKDGKPHIRVLHHLGGVEDLLRLIEQERATVQVASVSAGAVTALHRLAEEFDISGKINAALLHPRHAVQTRHGLRVGETLLAGIIRRICAPRSKRAFAAWAQETCLADLMGFTASDLTSQHFWDQMNAVPVTALEEIEQAIVRPGHRHRRIAAASPGLRYHQLLYPYRQHQYPPRVAATRTQ